MNAPGYIFKILDSIVTAVLVLMVHNVSWRALAEKSIGNYPMYIYHLAVAVFSEVYCWVSAPICPGSEYMRLPGVLVAGEP